MRASLRIMDVINANGFFFGSMRCHERESATRKLLATIGASHGGQMFAVRYRVATDSAERRSCVESCPLSLHCVSMCPSCAFDSMRTLFTRAHACAIFRQWRLMARSGRKHPHAPAACGLFAP